MAAAQWLLHNDRPVVQVVLTVLSGGQDLIRNLVADTGAGNRRSVFQLLMAESDCLRCGGIRMARVQLAGAYIGSFPVYLLRVRIPKLNFDQPVPIVGVAQVPPGLDGIAGFRFLNRFAYGNFDNPDYFGLDLLPAP